MTYRPLLIFAAAALVACGYRPNPIPLQATGDDLTPLRGDWSGLYTSSQSGRSGSISFALDAGADIAYGEVVMTHIAPNTRVLKSLDGAGEGGHPAYVAPRVLTIAFASISAGQVSGSLDAYEDPTCRCTVRTTFIGKLSRPNVLEGSYRTSGSSYMPPQSGTWKVTRVKP